MRQKTVFWVAAALAGVLLVPVQGSAEDEAKPQYSGVANCGKCHKSSKKGDQLGQWQSTKHSTAYATLASDESKAIAAERGIENPQTSGECLVCHVTAYGVDASEIEPIPEGKEGYSIEDGVGCESCHGAGSLYRKASIMRDKEKAMAAGLVDASHELCARCHNENSPTYKELNMEEAWAAIQHPNPLRAAEEGAE